MNESPDKAAMVIDEDATFFVTIVFKHKLLQTQVDDSTMYLR